MRRYLFILAVILLQAALAGSSVAAPKILSRDGSLVIENPDSKQAKKNPGSEDTLYELLDRKCRYIFLSRRPGFGPRFMGTPARLLSGNLDPQRSCRG